MARDPPRRPLIPPEVGLFAPAPGTDAISADDLTDTLTTFGDAGLHVRISENDVAHTTWGVDDRDDWFVDDDGRNGDTTGWSTTGRRRRSR